MAGWKRIKEILELTMRDTKRAITAHVSYILNVTKR